MARIATPAWAKAAGKQYSLAAYGHRASRRLYCPSPAAMVAASPALARLVALARLDARPTVRNGLKTNRRVPFADRPHVEQVDLPPGVLAEIPPRQLAEAADWSHAEAARRKEIALALIRQLEFDTSSAAVVPIADVAATVTTEYSRVRDRLLAIPGKVADELVMCDRRAIEVRLRSEVYEALSELSKQ